MPTERITRVARSDRDQLSKRPVISSLFGTSSSLPSQLPMVVARLRILVTTPFVSPTVITSPMRIGRSNRLG